MVSSDLQKMREQYLARLLVCYGTVTLPVDTTSLALPLQTVFQPMILRRDPFAPQNARADAELEVVKAQDGNEALSKSAHRRMVVLGGPGMGKTTALKALLSTAITAAQIDPAAPLPLFISLPDLMHVGLSFGAYIRRDLAKLEIDARFADTLAGAVNSGHAFLCLDSLDEVLPALRPDVIAFLNQEPPRCQGTWIIGSRFTEYKGGQFVHGQFAEWELQTLSAQERLALARQLLPALYHALYRDGVQNGKPALPSAEAYIAELQQSTQSAAWGENPLLLSLAAVLYIQTNRLPPSRAVLYAQVVAAMFAMRLHDTEQCVKLRYLLAEVALEFYQTCGRNFSITDVQEFLRPFISDQDTPSLTTTLTRILDSGVLEPIAYQTYGFKHQMFQEYLAAVALARRCMDSTQRQNTWNLLWRKRRLSRWNEILRLFVGVLAQEHGAEGLHMAQEWLSALAMEYDTSEGDPGNLCIILALNSLSELGEQLLGAQIADLTQHILEIWAKTFEELYRLGGWQYAQPLRVQAHVLGAFSLHIVAPILMRLQQCDPHIHVFYHISATGRLDFSLPMKLLFYLFQDMPISLYTCHMLHTLQNPVIIARLVAILTEIQGHWSLEEQEIVVKLLGKMGENTPLSLLIQIWQDTTLIDDIRESAVRALSETEMPVPPAIFIPMLNDLNHTIRAIAVEALGKRNGQAYADLLVAALQDPSRYVRENALHGLHELNIILPIELLQTLFYEDYEVASKEAWDCLQEIGDLVPLRLWLDALQHEYEWVRKYALMAIEQRKDQVPVEPILAMLTLRKKDSYWHRDVRTHCIQALGLLGERVPLEPLLALLHDNDAHIRSHALSVLTQRHVTLPADILLPMLDNITTGQAAVQAIVMMGENAPVSALLEIARSHAYHSANFAVQALRLLPAYVPTQPLLALLQNEEISNSSWGTYEEVIQLLQLQGVKIPLERLLPVLKHLSWQDEKSTPIITALSQAGNQAPIEPLLRLSYEEIYKTTFYPKWIQQLFYTLYEWVSPDALTNALSNTPGDQWLAVSLLGFVYDDESIQLITELAQDPTGDRTMRSEAMVVLSNLGVNLPLEYLIQATRWCIYEEMGGYLADTVKRLGQQAPLEQLLPLLGENHNRLQPGIVEALVDIAEYIPPATILALLEDPNELVRHAAIRILGAMRERAPLAVFVALLHDPEQTLETRCAVLSALGELGTPVAVDLLVEALASEETDIKSHALWALKDDDMQSRRGAIRAFKEQGKEIPLEPLLKLLNDPDEYVVKSSIQVLGELGSLGVTIPVEPLISLLSHDDEFIAGEAAEALCTLGERAPVEALLTHMSDTTNEQIRDNIFYALSFLKEYAPLEAMLALLAEYAETMDHWNVEYALENLANTVPERILQQLHDDPRPLMRRVVLQAIQTTKADEWLPLVLATLHDADGQYAAYDQNIHNNRNTVRSAAIKALGALNDCAPIEPLLQFLYTNTEDSSYNDTRIIVLEVLRQFGSRVPLTALWPLLGSNHTEICSLAFQHLQETYPTVRKELLPILKAMARGKPVQGAFAARLLYRIAETVAVMGRATPAVLTMVIDLLDHPFWEVRARAAKTLGTLRRNIPDSAIRRLLELRKDTESPDVRTAADQALAEILSLEQGMEDE